MRLRLGLFALASFLVFLLAAGVSTFVVDPENIGVRLGLYVLALLALIGVILFTVFAIVFPLFGRTGVDSEKIAAAVAAGRQALARVVEARPTGAQLSGAWAYDVRLIVAATDVPPYAISDRVRVHRTDGRLAGTGEVVTVVRLEAGDPHVVVVHGPGSTPQDGTVPREAPEWPGA